MNVRIGIAVLLVVLFPADAYAQTPSYSQPSNEESVHGRVASIPGKFDLTVRDDRGFIDYVHLHPGTIITPIGLTLVPGMTVTIIGSNRGKNFAANEIDTPYTNLDEYAPRVPPGYGYETGRCDTDYEHGNNDPSDSRGAALMNKRDVAAIGEVRRHRRGRKKHTTKGHSHVTHSGKPRRLAQRGRGFDVG